MGGKVASKSIALDELVTIELVFLRMYRPGCMKAATLADDYALAI